MAGPVKDGKKSPNLQRKLNEEKRNLQKLSHPLSLVELQSILSNISDENPISEKLFLGHVQIFIIEDFLPWQPLLGKLYKKTIAFCFAKPRKGSEEINIRNEVFVEDGGDPLPNLFDNMHRSLSKSSRCQSIIRALHLKYHLLPLSQNIGKKILSLCKMIEAELFQNLPVVAICHGNNPKAAVLMGCFPHKNSSLIITNQGAIKKQEQLARLSVLKESHLQGFPPSFSTIDTSVYAQYEFLEYKPSKKSRLNPSKDNNIYTECWWPDASMLLEPLTPKCSCFAKIKAVGGNNFTGACSIFKELNILETLQNGFQTGVITWGKPDPDVDIMKSLKEFINGRKTAVAKGEKRGVVIEDTTEEIKGFDRAVLEKRENLDFTDKLWLILKDISSCEELQGALTFVYKSLEDFFYPPYVHHKNMSSVALFVKKMKDRSRVSPDVTPKAAIQQLVEIGIVKLRRDFVTFFLRLGLIPFESISYFLQPEMVSTEAVTCLRKLHTVLELTIVCKKRLLLTKPLLREFVRTTLKHYTSVPDVDLSHVFTFQLPAVNARQLLNPMRPTIWEISFASSMDGFMKQSVHRYVTTPIQEHIYAPDNYHPRLLLKKASYTYLTATLIEDDTFEEDDD